MSPIFTASGITQTTATLNTTTATDVKTRSCTGGDGKVFTITARNVSAANKYIQSARLNGKPLGKPWFTHQDMMNGGTLILEMGSRPNTAWGSGPEAAPPSISAIQ